MGGTGIGYVRVGRGIEGVSGTLLHKIWNIVHETSHSRLFINILFFDNNFKRSFNERFLKLTLHVRFTMNKVVSKYTIVICRPYRS